MKQIAWYGFQIAVFGGVCWFFSWPEVNKDEPVNIAAVFIIAVAITTLATALVFWGGRLVALVARACFGQHSQPEHGRINGTRIACSREPRELSTGPRIGKQPR